MRNKAHYEILPFADKSDRKVFHSDSTKSFTLDTENGSSLQFFINRLNFIL